MARHCVSQLAGELVDSCQPLVTSIVLLPLHLVGHLSKLWIFIVEPKQFLCSMYSLSGIEISYGGMVYGFF